MSDDEMGAMRPAIPSRATGELKPLPLPEMPPLDTHRGRRKAKRAAPKRKKAKKPTFRQVTRQIAKRHPTKHPVLPKSPNRPLEAKKQLDAVLTVLDDLAKPELMVFTVTLKQLKGLSKPGRARVLHALQQVYPS